MTGFCMLRKSVLERNACPLFGELTIYMGKYFIIEVRFCQKNLEKPLK